MILRKGGSDMKKTSSILARRLLALTLAFLLVAGLTGCWKKDKADPAPSTDPIVETEPSTQAPTTTAPTEEVTEPVTEDTTPVQTNTMGTVTALWDFAGDTPTLPAAGDLKKETAPGTKRSWVRSLCSVSFYNNRRLK